MLRSLAKGSMQERVKQWVSRISGKEIKIPAGELYAGDHWKVVESLVALGASSGYEVKIWICSGGYGLLSPQCQVVPYSATFSKNHPDSVSKKVLGGYLENHNSSWWDHLAKWKGPGGDKPRTLIDLVNDGSGSPVWLVGSDEYLKALTTDLARLKSRVGFSDNLSIFSAGTCGSADIDENLIPMDGRFQNVVGGTMGSLNIRVARKALEDIKKTGPSFSALSARFRKLLAQQPPLISFNRKSMTDNQVVSYIEKELSKNNKACFSPLLRQLRDSGFACEYDRFSSIFLNIKDRYEK